LDLIAGGIREVLSRRRLIAYMVRADLKKSGSDTLLGNVWWVVDPLLQMLIYSVLVTLIFDRKVEAYGVTVSKQMCDKPIASELWELEDVIGHWDQMVLRSHAWIDGARVLYQEGTLDGMLPVKDLIARGFGPRGLPDGCAMFGGTFAAKGGIRPASRFEFELEDPVLKRTIRHGYDVITLPVLG